MRWNKMLVSACAIAMLGLGVCQTIVPSAMADYSKPKGSVAVSYHAKDRMKERGVASAEIKKACLFGDKFYDQLHDNYVYYHKATGVFVSVKNETVVTVIRKETNLDLSKQKRYLKVLNDDGDRIKVK